MSDIRINLEDIPSLEGKRVIVSGQYVSKTKTIGIYVNLQRLLLLFSLSLSLVL